VASVELKNVTKIYGNQVKAIDNASLVIDDKEFVVLVGPSGCGKSTILRMIAGLEEVTVGKIYIASQPVNHVPPKNRDIAMVFQNYALYPHMTVYDNMAFGLKLRKVSKIEIKKRVQEAADILHIQDLLDRKPKELSGGQRQRVAVGRAIVRKPKVFLFDEPLSNLDAKLRVQMRIEINRLYNQLETTMIYVTHDQVEAMTMGSKIVILNNGIIQQTDSPLNLYNDPINRFVAGFIGSPSMNFFHGKIILDKTVKFKSKLFEFTLPDKLGSNLKTYSRNDVIFGIRPENIRVKSMLRTGLFSESQKIIVDVIEPVGNEIFLYFSDGSHSYCMRMPPVKLFDIGERIEIAFDLDKIYFFDPVTNERIV